MSQPVTASVCDADLMVELVATLRDAGVDLEATALERLERGDQTRAVLAQLEADLLARLHHRSDDISATKALQAVHTATTRLGADHDRSRSPADRITGSTRAVTTSSVHSLARRLLRPWLVGCLVVVALLAFLLSRVDTAWLLYVVFIGASLAVGFVCWTTLVWMVFAWRDPAAFDETRLPAERLGTHQSFSLILPARHEEQVLEQTLLRLVETEHPAFEVLVVVGTDDLLTREVAERVAAAHPDHVRVVLDHSWPKNKPKALNTALPYCAGEITGVFDAEDDVHPDLIQRVDQCFQQSGADVVQAGVQLTNIRSSWFAVRNALEYYFWFRSRLHFHARAGFIPLGGNTVFVRTSVLRAVGGWDPECLAEDCELGVRLSSFGAKTVVFYEPELATREETPSHLGAFVRQRTRWNQGYLQTLSRNYWRRLPLKRRALGLYTLAMPYMMALVWVMLPLALATALIVKVPVPVALLSFLPAIPMLAVLAIEVAGLGELCRSFGLRARIRDYARLALSLPIYQTVLAFAALRAVIREARGVRSWEKTAHFGLHLESPDQHVGSATLALHPSTVGAPAVVGAMSREPAMPDTVGHVGVSAPGATDGPEVPYLAWKPPVALTFAGNGNCEHNGSGAIANLAPPTTGAPMWMRLGTGSVNGSGVLAPSTAPIERAGGTEARAKRLGSFFEHLRTSRGAVAMLLAFFVLVGLVQVVNLAHWPDTFFDEGTYVSNAWAVPHGALSNYTYGYGHPPLGWLMVSLWTSTSGLFGHTLYSVVVGRQLMVALSIVSCGLLYVFARRLGMARSFAAGAVALFALSPVALYFHRLVLIDNPGVTWALAALVLALSPRRRLWVFAASGACFAASVLSKETMLILLPALLLAAAQNSDRRTRRYCLTILGSFLVLIVLAYPLYATLKGELLPGPGHVSMFDEIRTQLVTRKATGSLFDPQSQTYGIVHFWLHLDPWLLGVAFVLAPIALARRATRVAAVAFLVQCAMVFRPGYLPFMYVIGILPFAALIVAGTAEMLWRVARAGPQRLAAGRQPAPGPTAGNGHVAVAGLMLDDRRPVFSSDAQWPSGGTGGLETGRRVHHWPFLSSSMMRARTAWRATAPRVSRTLVPVARAGAATLLVLLVGAFAIAAGPRWASADRQAMTAKLDGPELAAQQWLLHNVDHDKRLLVSDDFWVFLIEHGFDAHPVRGGFFSRTVVFYWPFDFDPAVRHEFPQGWRDLDYIVSTQGMRNDTTEVPRTARALEHSRVVVTFGRGDQRIEIRSIERDAPAPAVSSRPSATVKPA